MIEKGFKMADELMITTREFKNNKLQTFTNQIYKQGLNIKKSYARIASILAKIDMSKCFEADGFESVHDYAKQVLGINKSQSYAFLKIGYEYIDSKSLESVLKHDEGNDFSMSQLQAILPLKSVKTAQELAEQNIINPSMTVKEIKDVVKDYTHPKEEKEDDSSESDEIIEVDAIDASNFQVESVFEFAIDNEGKKVLIYGDELLTVKQATEIIIDWFK